jgi:molybdopterin/thiamine biosynthesis adenylyltransferase
VSDRYSRQTRFLGADAQAKLASSTVAVVGVGALGGTGAALLARAGVGRLRVIDRDLIEPHNLQRQELFDEADLADDLPKAEAAARRLRRINGEIQVEPVVADLNRTNIRELLAGADAVFDGLDNFTTRFLLNDYCCHTKTPWVFGGCLGGSGQVMAILPGRTPCLRCVIPEPPPTAAMPTCETAGVLGPAVGVVASLQTAELMKILIGEEARLRKGLFFVDVWDNVARSLDMSVLNQTDCPCCKQGRYDWLEGAEHETSAKLCGSTSVQVSPSSPRKLNLDELGKRLSEIGTAKANTHLLRFQCPEAALTIFADGRVLVHGCDDLDRAKSLYSRFLGD